MQIAGTSALVMLVSLVACSSPDSASVRENAPPAAAPAPIAVWYDDTALRPVALPDGADKVPLDRLLSGKFADRNSWREVRANGGTGKLTAIHPAETYKEHTFCLFRDRDGKVSLGLFRDLENVPSALKGPLQKPVMQVAGVEEIFIRTTPTEAGVAPFSTVLLSAGKKPPMTLDRKVMSEVPRGSDRKAGWKLADVARLIVPSERIDHLMLHSTDGRSLRVDSELMAASTLKVNKRGIWKFKPPEAEDFSPIARIEVFSRKSDATE